MVVLDEQQFQDDEYREILVTMVECGNELKKVFFCMNVLNVMDGCVKD